MGICYAGQRYYQHTNRQTKNPDDVKQSDAVVRIFLFQLCSGEEISCSCQSERSIFNCSGFGL